MAQIKIASLTENLLIICKKKPRLRFHILNVYKGILTLGLGQSYIKIQTPIDI